MLDPVDRINAIDPFSRTVVHLTMYFKAQDSRASDRQKLATGTGFVRESGGRYFLITARHNLTGRHPDTDKPISVKCGIPNELDVEGFHLQESMKLYESSNDPNDAEHCPPRFWEHPTDPTIDIAVLPITVPSEWPMGLDESFFDENLNEMAVSLFVTQTCFVVGFPLDLVDRSVPDHLLPIYKTANIASEPYIDFQGRPTLIIDATTRN